jgi:hypothetical protein
VILVCVAAALGGCSDDSDPDSDEASGNTTTSASGDAREEIRRRLHECADVTKATAAVPGEAVVDGRTDYPLAAKKWRAFADAAPADIKDDVEVVAAQYALLAETFADIGYDPNGDTPPTPEQQTRISEINTPEATEEFTSANDRVNQWLESCGRGR